ncbi:MAG: hypothetical protein IPK75_20295 [Acidobacteria bacterium]|nr:hypothetical protein [Acidobacteriota bacterium]
MAFLGGIAYLVYRSYSAPAGGDDGNGSGGGSGGSSSDNGGAGGGSGASGNNTTGEGGRGDAGSAGGAAWVDNEANRMKAAKDKVFAATVPATFKLTADQWNYYRAKALNSDPINKELWPAGKTREHLMTAAEWHAQLAANGFSGLFGYENYQATPGRRSQGVFF